MIDSPKWQEYRTHDEWLMMIRPEVRKVVKLKECSHVGEQIYWAKIQRVS